MRQPWIFREPLPVAAGHACRDVKRGGQNVGQSQRLCRFSRSFAGFTIQEITFGNWTEFRGQPTDVRRLFAAVLVMVLIDMFALNRAGNHKVSVREALGWSAVWFAIAMLFNAWLWWHIRGDVGSWPGRGCPPGAGQSESAGIHDWLSD